MSRLWPAELRIGMCPDRLVLRDAIQPVSGDPVSALRDIAAGARTTVVLSNHFVRYAVLPWSKELASEQEWQAYAKHSFNAVYGSRASAWRILISGSGRAPRVASAVDAALIDALRGLPGVTSIQPYLMAAFNACRKAIGKRTTWFVVQEPDRLMLCLLVDGSWRVIRSRQAREDWRAHLPDLLDRELACVSEQSCNQAAVFSEEELPSTLGRYRLTDVTLPRGSALESRARAMAMSRT